MGEIKTLDHILSEGLTDVFSSVHMGITAENIAERLNISRISQDEFAYGSQLKAIKAVDSGRFNDEIIPVKIIDKKKEMIIDKDEHPNRTTDLIKLSQLKPAFKQDGTVTAGNSSGINDGAAFVAVAGESALQKYNLTPLVEIIAVAQAGIDPQVMGLAPAAAIDKALRAANIKLSDIDLIELNEAFAAQALGVVSLLVKEQGVSAEFMAERTNVNGGAIALGHPLGASGARVTVSLIHEMLKRGVNYGLASLCIGGGMGIALILRKI